MAPKTTKAPTKTAQERALEAFQAKFSKSFGEKTLTRPVIKPYDVISTGSVALDFATGVGGYVEGRQHEIYGPEGIGKTALATLGLVEAQKKYPEKQVALINMEKTFDAKWAQTLGLDLQRIFQVDTNSSEEVADQLKMILSSGLFSMVVVDSIGAMIAEAEKIKDAGESAMGKNPGIVTRMVKMGSVEAAISKTVVIYINQFRADLSGSKATVNTPGGFALKYCSTLKFKMRRTGDPQLKVTIDGVEEIVGSEIAVQIERNKVAFGQKVAKYWFLNRSSKYGPVGIDRSDEAVVLGMRKEVGEIIQSGAWYTLKTTGEQFQGKAGLKETLRAHPEIIDTIRMKALDAVKDDIIEDALEDLSTITEDGEPDES